MGTNSDLQIENAEMGAETKKFEEVIIPEFEAWMKEKTFVPAVEICPYDGEYIGATDTEDVVRQFLDDTVDYEEYEDRLIDYASDDGPYGQESDYGDEPKAV